MNQGEYRSMRAVLPSYNKPGEEEKQDAALFKRLKLELLYDIAKSLEVIAETLKEK